MVLALATATARAESPPQVLSFGIGRLSCASWLNSPAADTDMNGWILGYWTAMNMYLPSHLVGSDTDGIGIVAEIRAKCRQSPSQIVYRVINEFYGQMLNRR